jgi:hypothetical protein
MIISTNQPYFLPFPGFFYKAHLSDIFVVLDTVQFPRGTSWVSRNRFKNDQGALWLSVPVWKKGLGLQRIHEVRICHEVQQAGFEKLIEFNLAFIRYLFRQLKIETEIKLLSELGIHTAGTQRAAAKYLNREPFRQEGVEIHLIKPPAYVYPQLWGDFVSNLSAFDMLFNCGPKAHDILTRTN